MEVYKPVQRLNLMPVYTYLGLAGFDGHLNDVRIPTSSSPPSLRSIVL